MRWLTQKLSIMCSRSPLVAEVLAWSGRRHVGLGQHCRALLDNVAVRIHLMFEQQIDFGAEIGVVRTSGIEKRSSSRRLELERVAEQLFHLLPALRCDVGLPPAAELAPQPKLRGVPFAFGRRWRYAKHF